MGSLVVEKMTCRSRSGFGLLLLALAGVCIAFACWAEPVFARASANNTAATRAYLRARVVFERDLYAKLGAIVAAVEGRATQIAAECPSALTYAPRDMAFEELDEEVSLTVVWAGVAPVRSSMLALAQAIWGLRWTSQKLTRFVHALALEERAIAHIALPNVCADIAAWKTSAYATLPPSTNTFLTRALAIELSSNGGSSEESSEAAIMSLLRPYEDPAERRVAGRVERLDGLVGKRMNVVLAATSVRLASALGVSAL